MSCRDVPVRLTRRLIEVNAVMDAQLYVIEGGAEIEIDGRIVKRVSAENHQQLDRAALHLTDKFRQSNSVRREFNRRRR